jgi:hypothetical protein
MGILDIILFPFYVYIFYIIFALRRKRIKDPILRQYQKNAFWIKIVCTVAITIFNVYLSPGDSTSLYYPEGHNIFNLILKDGENIKWLFKAGNDFDRSLVFNSNNAGYFKSEANFFIIRLVAIFSFVSFGCYSVIQLFFSMIAFTGIWKLFKFFYELYPRLHKKLAIAILYLPTLAFWSSGVLKDPICMGMLGWLTYAVYAGYYKKVSVIKNTIVASIAAIILSIVKPYILFAYVPFLILYLILKNIHIISNPLVRFGVIIFISMFSIGGFIILSEKLQEEMGNLAIEKLSESIQTQQKNFINMADRAESSFSLGVEYDGSAGSLLRMAPAAINATLFRPYLWESKKISTLLSSLESLTLMLLTLFVLFRVGPIPFFTTIFKDPMVMFCFFFSVLFALFIGATTLNFGTLVRYKIPCMPFFVIALLLIYERKNLQKIASLKKEAVV